MPGNRHGWTARRLDAFVDDELDAETAPRVAAHLARCPGCAHAARTTREIKVCLGNLGAERPMDLATGRLRRFAHELGDR